MAVTISGSTGIDKVVDGSIAAVDLAANAVTTAKIADDAITLAKMAPGTDGNLITYDASQNPAYVATGTAGQLLTSAGTGAPPTFTTVSSGGVTHLGTMTTTSGTTQTLSDLDLSIYNVLMISINQVSHSGGASGQIELGFGVGADFGFGNPASSTQGMNHLYFIDLSTNNFWAMCDSALAIITTGSSKNNGFNQSGIYEKAQNLQVASTTVHVSMENGYTFDNGSVEVYGLK
jgi:hypothetical protein